MISRDEAERLVAEEGHVVTASGWDAGPVARVFLDEYTNWPSFLTVAATEPGRERFVALHEAEIQGEDVRVPYPQDKIEGAPQVAVDADLSIEEEDDLFDYYGVPIEGVEPSVAHLGSVLEPDGRDEVSERDTDRPDS